MPSNHLGSGGSSDLSFLCSLTNITSLTVLSIRQNKLGGLFPGCIGNFSITIKILELAVNPIIGEIPKAIGNLANLESLGIFNTIISGAIPFELGNLPNLTILELSNNNLSGLIPSSLQKMKKLIRLHLQGNNFHGYIPSHLDKCQNLMDLDLSNNNLSGSIFPVINTLVNLVLSHNHLNGALPAELGKMEHLVTLDISGNMFRGKIPSTLGDCVGLFALRMRDNQFQGSIPQSFRSLRSIEEFDLSNNNLSGEIPKFLVAFLFLEILNLSYNNFEGILPTKGVFENASATFIAGNNKICGGIPKFRLPKCISRHSKSKGEVHKLKLTLFIIFGLLGVVLVLIFVTENGTNVAVKVFNLMRHGALKSFKAECEALNQDCLESTSYTNINMSSADLRGTIGYAAPEYGMGSGVSIEGDFYSYGILLLEMFTGIGPAVEIFKENSNLHNFVEEALLERVLEITDPILVQEVESDAGQRRKSTVQDCLLKIYRIGIACSVGVPRERMSIANVAVQLCSIRNGLYAAGL
ncbi:probable LRR receptor-like serine/threonine-protein kinase At3g47570 [Eucalyptus grandis]|uniref:probable LRR receptor-like serine/threonine-protein kinase At3g47570 n=1 Tax=Eucalyptus grandis TaxID=71139 RepID=UPI00192EF53D|nr:probable LRR receptor-like serine/threonine-protein kinase At3g47570 [Eucalyptus grandis]